jgi:hypothetical protein
MLANTAVANGKVFSIFAPRAYETTKGLVIAYNYRSTRDGLGEEEFGPIRTAISAAAPKSVGGQLVAGGQEHFNADHDAMFAEHARRKEAADQYTTVVVPLITKS